MEIAIRRREQEVWQACDDLWAMHGEMGDMTGDAIRDRLIKLGKSRGSPNEIYKYRKTWVKSRGLDTPTDKTLGNTEDDPITRAVRLVHEKLKSEAGDHIAHLQGEFEERLRQKEEELKKVKDALDHVMTEFSELGKERDSLRIAHASCEELLLAEVEIRKASERELQMNKTLREQEQKANELLICEVKALYEQQLQQRITYEKERETIAKDALEQLIGEKKQLGYEYSEKLTELKTIIYNQGILVKQLETKLMDSKREVEEITNFLAAKDQQIDLLAKENTTLLSTVSAHRTEIHLIKETEEGKNTELKSLSIALKKSELTIARLRAYAMKG